MGSSFLIFLLSKEQQTEKIHRVEVDKKLYCFLPDVTSEKMSFIL